MKHIVVASIVVIVVATLAILGLRAANLVPPLASAEGVFVDQLFQWQMYVIAIIFALIIGFLLYAVVAFRRKPGETGDGRHITGNAPLEIAWTVIPLIIVMGFGVVSASHLNEMTASDPNELVVEVTGFQFGWRFDYVESGVSSPDLYLPLGRQILFKITSTDVIHSFWVPEFRIKQDAVPGRWTTLRVTPTEIGDFRIRCAEMCGYAHSAMYAPVVVIEPADFETWLAGKPIQVPSTDLTPVEQGAQLAQEQGCLSCHSVDGSPLVGPSWLGLFESQRAMEGGDAVQADETYLRESILEPGAHVVRGFPNIMPDAYDFLSGEELDAIIEYMKSMGP